MTTSNFDFLTTTRPNRDYDFSKIHSQKVCAEIQSNSQEEANLERFKAMVYTVASAILPIFFNIHVGGYILVQVLSVSYLITPTWKKSEHYANMKEFASFRLSELQDKNKPSRLSLKIATNLVALTAIGYAGYLAGSNPEWSNLLSDLKERATGTFNVLNKVVFESD